VYFGCPKQFILATRRGDAHVELASRQTPSSDHDDVVLFAGVGSHLKLEFWQSFFSSRRVVVSLIAIKLKA
jgi:hypothetical protein